MNNSIPTHYLSRSSFCFLTIEDADDNTFDGLHRHAFFELIWFTKTGNNSVVEIDFKHYPIGDDTICIITPGQVTNFNRTQEEGYVLAFSKELFNELMVETPAYKAGMLPQDLTVAAIEPIRILTTLIKQEKDAENRFELIKAYLTSFLIHAMSSVIETKTDDEDRINKLTNVIEQHYLEHKEIAFYTSYFNISAKRLNEISKKLRGLTVKELITDRIVLEAKREIHFGKLTFKEIAYKLGFSDAAYFSRFFKSQTGLTAAQFKESTSSFKIN